MEDLHHLVLLLLHLTEVIQPQVRLRLSRVPHLRQWLPLRPTPQRMRLLPQLLHQLEAVS